MAINPKKVEIFRNRMKQGGLAMLGCLAVLGSTFIRAVTNRGQEIDTEKALKYSLALSAGAGLAWSVMPRAAEPVSQSWTAIRAEVNSITRIAANQAIPTPEAMNTAARTTTRETLYDSYPSSTSYRTQAERRESPGRSLSIIHPSDRRFTLDDSMYDTDRTR